MDMVSLTATARDLKANPKVLRRANQVPCVVYGYKAQMNVQCPEKELHSAFIKAGESTLVELDVGGKKIPVLFKAVDFHPVTDREIHVDFFAVDMNKEIETLVPVHFEGDAPAVKTLGGVIVISHDHVKVRCLPKSLPHSITVNISTLEAFHASVSVKDLQVPTGVKVMDAPITVLLTIQEPRAIEVITPVAAAVPVEGAAAVPGAEGAPAAEGAAKEGAAATAETQAKEKAAKEKGGGKEKKK